MGIFSFLYSTASLGVEEQDGVIPETIQKLQLLKDGQTLDRGSELQSAPACVRIRLRTDAAPTSSGTPAMAAQNITSDDSGTGVRLRLFSFRFLSFGSKFHTEHKRSLSSVQEHDIKAHVHTAFSKRFIKSRISKSDKRAKQSALIVRSLIIGPTATASPQLTPAHAKPQLSQIKSQLIKPKSANKVIAQLRALPVSDTEGSAYGRGPIHAVCLEHTDAEEHKLHFSCLSENIEGEDKLTGTANAAGISSISLNKLASVFMEMNIVDLVSSPDLGLGQPGDGQGILAGAVPTAETVLKGIEMITPQLMALGFATGKAVLPDHAGVYPPTDRMSVLTYWWGLELVLPPPSLEYLANAQSIAGTVVNFLSALSLINNGVREILPFVRYIAQFIDFEFNNIKRQDKGRGVVCAATWIMPAALVPRPWDFPDPPVQRILPIEDGEKPISDPPAVPPPSQPKTPPFAIPLPLPQMPISLQSVTQPTLSPPAITTSVAPTE